MSSVITETRKPALYLWDILALIVLAATILYVLLPSTDWYEHVQDHLLRSMIPFAGILLTAILAYLGTRANRNREPRSKAIVNLVRFGIWITLLVLAVIVLIHFVPALLAL